ncbi:MAG: hypothetical protein DMF63_15490 [Acidobacteria bacterium]|nr:MAG: hypothetical protein DMF63_15490 [Acidobacteriota bacterium]
MTYLSLHQYRGWSASLAAVLLTAAMTFVAFAQQPGDLDPTFSGDGELIGGVTYANDYAYAIAIQADGKIVAAGNSYGDNNSNAKFALSRYNPDGSLDTSFDDDGRVTTPIGSSGAYAYAYAVAIQADGKIVAAGWSYGASSLDFALVRYNADGSLDTSFDSDGKVTTPGGAAYAVAIQPDGKIVAAGDSASDFVLVRYNPDGSLDTTFDGDGKVTTPVGTSGDAANAVAIQADGKIVAAGYSYNGSFRDFALVRYNPNGLLDPTFDGDGKVTTPIGMSEDIATAVAIQPDERIVAAGYSSDGSSPDFALVRYNENGSLDPTFDGDGKVTTPVGMYNDIATAVALQPDGKIVVAGYIIDSVVSFALVRYHPNGSLDNTFDSDGKVTTSIGTSNDSAYAVALQPNGKIVAAGRSSDGSFLDFAIVRYNPNGSLDPTFDSDGKVTTDFGFWAGNSFYDVAIQIDGKVVAVSYSNNGTSYEFTSAVVRYNPDGSLDTAFDTDGTVTISNFRAAGCAIQSDGKILVSGYSLGSSSTDFALVRYNPDGSPDTSFGGNGRVTTPIGTSGDYAYALAIQSDGKIIAAGTRENGSLSDIALVRYNPNGSLDTTFDFDGIVTTPGGIAYAVAIQADGKILAAGRTYDGLSAAWDVALVRYNPNGSLDTTFDGDGKVRTPIGMYNDIATAVVIQPDGKIVAAGSSDDGSFWDFALVRYNPNGSLDTTFDSDGKVTTPIGTSTEYANAVALQPDGKIVAAGHSYNNSNSDFAIVRYNPDGSLDTNFGGDGITTVDFNSSDDQANGMALDGQGRAVLVGRSDGAFAVARVLMKANKARFDFDGDGRSDVSVFRPGDSVWYIDRSSAGFTSTRFGVATDKITPADYDGDGKTEISIFRDGTWWWINSSDSTVSAVQFGLAGDVPVPADYTGDGRDDLTVYRNGQWWIRDLSSGNSTLSNFGISSDKPVPADYDGDGKIDIAIYRDGTWWRINSSTGLVEVTQFGLASDRPVVGDYDRDSKTDLAVYRDGVWYVLQSRDGFRAFPFGIASDIPAPADYDGDGKTDAAVYRNGIWYVLNSTGGVTIQLFGLPGDKPAPAAFLSQ